MTDPLTEIGLRTDTDKAKFHGYTKYYHELLKDFRDKPLFFLELGFGGYEWNDTGGESIHMWVEYAPAWDIAVIDLYDKQAHLVPEGVDFIQCSQDDPEGLARVIAKHGRPTIIVDDASHVPGPTLAAFNILWPYVVPGGWYIIEDIATGYDPLHDGNPTGANTQIEFSKGAIDSIMANSRHGKDRGFLPGIKNLGIDIMHVMPGAVGFRKR